MMEHNPHNDIPTTSTKPDQYKINEAFPPPPKHTKNETQLI